MIHSRVVLICVDALFPDRQQIEGPGKARRRKRYFIEQSLGGCIDAKIRIIVEIGGTEAREVARAFRNRWYIVFLGQRIAGSLSIIIDKEERLVPDDGPTHGCAELVFPERRRDTGRSEEILGVEDVVAQKFVNASMEIIGPRFRNDVDYAAGFSAEFRPEDSRRLRSAEPVPEIDGLSMEGQRLVRFESRP